MTKPTPTEEQRLTARAFCGVDQDDAWEEAVAALLAEREAPLRERAEKAEAALANVEAEKGAVSALTYAARTEERDAALAEVARLRKLFDDAGQGEQNALAVVDLVLEREQEANAALAASRAEVEALRAVLREALSACALNCTLDSYCGRCWPLVAALSSTPAPASAEPATPTVRDPVAEAHKDGPCGWSGCGYCSEPTTEGGAK